MPVINYWLLSCVVAFLVISLSNLFLKLILLFGLGFYLAKGKIRFRFLIYFLLALILLQSGLIKKPPSEYKGIITQVNTSNVIVKISHQEILVTNIKNASLYQRIEFQGSYQIITGQKSTFGFDKEKHYHKRNIHYEINPVTYQLLDNNNWRYHFIQSLNNLENNTIRNHLLKTFFQSYEIVFDFDFFNSIFYSKVLLINSLYYFFYRIFNYFFDEKKISIGFKIFLILLSYFFNSYLILLRFLIREFLKSTNLTRLDKWCFEILLLLAIKPFYLFQVGFLIIESIALLRVFSSKKSLLINFLAIAPINLYQFYELNLIKIILYPLFRGLSLINLFLIIICWIMKKEIILLLFINLINKINFFEITLTGKPNLLWLIIWFQIASAFLIDRSSKKIMILIELLILNQYQAYLVPFDIVTYLAIGQGDCSIIQFSFLQDLIIIDTGNTYNYHYLVNYLKARGIKKIPWLIITHQDSDHSGNKAALIKDFKVLNLVETKQDVETKKTKLIALLKTYQGKDENENSLVYFFNFNRKNYLFLGDVSFATEREIYYDYPNLKYDFIKVAHHGSKTSTNPLLYQQALGKIALISSGYRNIYGHPDSEVMAVFKDYLIKIFNTSEVGDVYLISNYFFHLLYNNQNQIFLLRD